MAEPLTLDLRSLPDRCELLPSTSRSIAAAASVRLEQLHGERVDDPMALQSDDLRRTGQIIRLPIQQDARNTYDDPEEATEEGAEAIAILVARDLLDRVVFRRLPKHTGADYRMRAATAAADGDEYERLECSGIGDGRDSASTRLREKLSQMAAHDAGRPGHAIVTRFGREPVEILVARYPR